MILFEQPTLIPFLPAAVVLLYCVLSRKSMATTAETVLKCVAGFYLICIGGSVTGAVFSPINHLMVANYGIRAGVLNTESFAALLLSSCGNAAFAAFLTAFITNLLIARYSGRPYMFLTCHHLLFLSLLSLSLIRERTGLSLIPAILLGGILTGVYVWGITAISSLPMRLINPDKKAALSNSANAAGMAAFLTGKCCGKRTGSAYGKEGRSQVSVFLVGTVTVFALYIVLYGMTRCLTPQRLSHALTQSILFGASSSILMLGIRMFLSPLIALLWDITRKVLPVPIAGLDATAMIAYSPRAWNVGFIFSCVGGFIITCLCLILRASFVPLPGITSLYFAGGVSGVVGNAAGGKRGAALSGVVTGSLVMFLCFAFMSVAKLPLSSGTAPGETEYSILGWIILLICKLIP